MEEYNVKLLREEEVATGTKAFYFAKPANFKYVAGQFLDYTLINPPKTDAEGDLRAFSLITAPYEEEIGFATRMRETAFKEVLKNLPLGSEVKIDGPYGDFVLHEEETMPAVFVIGGIGVTPVLSMVKEATHNKSKHQLVLFHADKAPADAPFKKEFEGLAQENPNFKYVQVFDGEQVSGQDIEYGRMSAEILKKYIPDLNAPKYYLSGPQGMVKAMREMLLAEKIDEDNIRTEEFSGY